MNPVIALQNLSHAYGRAEAMLDPIVSRWDLSAVRVIVEEAGGRFTDFAGGDPFVAETRPYEAISSNGLVHERLLEAFRAEVPACG